ncbi:hypothetical protein LAJ19_14580 (plasmid) [Deinococcus taeanensis]|uniref:hypothetical protein n=1 Tax=Deinococcus taeanensis TaxID=2737050 RepID=UPI001CDC4C3F|nr:hypothetical protein [Deinococcus taeanensis]UBV44390.1 hypothetical protein LAJ19_14580 [Deinococcus taeanensis]
MNTQQVAKGLGLFSLGLGVLEVVAPGRLTRFLGVKDHNALVRGYGARELMAGAGLLLQPGARAAWLWSRVAGDVLDLATLGMAKPGEASGRKRTANALAMVTAITVVDVLTARAFSQGARPVKSRLRGLLAGGR